MPPLRVRHIGFGTSSSGTSGSGSVERVSDESITSDDQPAEQSRADERPVREPLDLERIERDLAGVETALGRLDDGSYWTDEVTDRPIPDEVLAADPVARRAG